MGFITSILLDSLLLTTGAAGVRRWMHLSLRGWIEPKIANPYAKIGVRGFFDVGEFVVSKSIKFLENTRVASHMPKIKDAARKKD
mmetsp:Transcript_2779/g.3111  ORF Transcript_2779/g.3111 Transcript_2779/m.3111 type:complete len:85 (-) Transcript_2779:27-281(-)